MNTFRSLLLEIGQQLTTPELDHLKFACSDFIPAGRAEAIDRPHLLFLEMERQDKLAESKKGLLAELLKQIGRNDLRNKLLGIQEERMFSSLHDKGPFPETLSKKNATQEMFLKLNLADKISISWKYVGRYLAIKDYVLNNIEDTYRRTEERSIQMLSKWLQGSNDTSVGRLTTALRNAGRTDLAEEVQEYTRNVFDMRNIGSALPDGGQGNTRQPQEQDHRPTRATGGNTADHVADRGVSPQINVENDEVTAQPIPVEQDREDSKKEGSFYDENHYTIASKVSSGGFAKVYIVLDKMTGEKFAVKVIDYDIKDKSTDKHFRELEREVNLLRGLNNCYILKYIKTDQVKDTFSFFMEFMPGGTIADIIKIDGRINEEQVRKYTWQILNGIQYLHENKVIHRNLKASNILLDKDHRFIKLTDYGISHAIEGIATSTGHWYSGMMASVYWTSPELLCAERYTFNTDIWSLGCTIVEMLMGTPPLKGQKHSLVQVMFKITNYQIQAPEECTSIAKDFLDHCFKKRDERPAAASLLDSEHFPFPLYDDF